jgi:hypothetical protein
MNRGMQALAWITACLATVPAAAAASIGSPAPAVEPSEWLNTKGPTSWKDLKGRVILVEKWATW